MQYKTRSASEEDFEFLFQLKKAAELEAVKAVFGWDEDLQLKIHKQEWDDAQPTIIEINGVRSGSYLLQEKNDHFHFGRFFLLPEFHGKGIGSRILKYVIEISKEKQKSIRLVVLQGNKVLGLYQRFGFKIVKEDEQFIQMALEV